jgi:hypothetical protein
MSGNTEEEKKVSDTCKTRDNKGRLLPGYTANPNGRPRKGMALAELLREYLDGSVDDSDCKTRKEAFICAVYEKAMSGSNDAMRLVMEYIDGKAVQTVNTTVRRENAAIEMLKKMQAEYDKTDKADIDPTGTTA